MSLPKIQNHRSPVKCNREICKFHAAHINWRSEWIIRAQWMDFLVTPGVLSDAVIVTNVQQSGSCLPEHPAVTGSTLASLFPAADQSCLVCPGAVWALYSFCGVDKTFLQDTFNFEKKPRSSCPVQHFQCALCCGCHLASCKLLGSLKML